MIHCRTGIIEYLKDDEDDGENDDDGKDDRRWDEQLDLTIMMLG